MSQIADALIDIVALTPEADKPQVKLICAAIMKHSMQLDLLTKQSIQLMQDKHAAEVKALRDEITSYEGLLTQAEIRVALTKLCKRHRLDPGIVERLLPQCQMGYRDLVILDEFGVPTTFADAIASLEGN